MTYRRVSGEVYSMRKLQHCIETKESFLCRIGIGNPPSWGFRIASWRSYDGWLVLRHGWAVVLVFCVRTVLEWFLTGLTIFFSFWTWIVTNSGISVLHSELRDLTTLMLHFSYIVNTGADRRISMPNSNISVCNWCAIRRRYHAHDLSSLHQIFEGPSPWPNTNILYISRDFGLQRLWGPDAHRTGSLSTVGHRASGREV